MTATIHRCAECHHKDGDHALASGSRCSMGGCSCVIGQPTVIEVNPPEQIPTFPGYDRATGKWAAR